MSEKKLTVPQEVEETEEEAELHFHKTMNLARVGVGLAPIYMWQERRRERLRRMTPEEKKVEIEKAKRVYTCTVADIFDRLRPEHYEVLKLLMETPHNRRYFVHRGLLKPLKYVRNLSLVKSINLARAKGQFNYTFRLTRTGREALNRVKKGKNKS